MSERLARGAERHSARAKWRAKMGLSLVPFIERVLVPSRAPVIVPSLVVRAMPPEALAKVQTSIRMSPEL